MSVVLIGMMGVGKSTLGRAASKALGWRYVDIDHQIERTENRTIADIFRQDGEPHFRELESEAIEKLRGAKQVVVSTGGGAPIEPGNLARMRAIGPVVYLEASAGALIRRLKNSRTERPMLGADIDSRVVQLLAARQHIYRQADFRIHVDDSSPMQIVLEIKRIAEDHS